MGTEMTVEKTPGERMADFVARLMQVDAELRSQGHSLEALLEHVARQGFGLTLTPTGD